MATKTPKKKVTPVKSEAKIENIKTTDDLIGGELDPKEEKVLDWILNGVVIFVLGWLALGILLSVGGLFGLWK
jgi:hypothetical protein